MRWNLAALEVTAELAPQLQSFDRALVCLLGPSEEERGVHPRMAKETLVGAGRLADLQAEDLYRLAVTDPLTGCYNRRFFYEVIERELERHRRHGIPLSLLFIDINHFKKVNDSLGHEAGDLVLQSVADFLKRHVRRADYLFRWGGDEFLILIWGTLKSARRMRTQLKARFRSLSDNSRRPDRLKLSLSIGCVEFGPGACDVASGLGEADKQMYRDKPHVDIEGRRRTNLEFAGK
jgi:diguanylate cyclase (GGDEF)-like protein